MGEERYRRKSKEIVGGRQKKRKEKGKRRRVRDGWGRGRRWVEEINEWLAVKNKKRRPDPSHLHSPYRYFFALVRTRPSNTPPRIVVCAVWNGFSIACGESAHSGDDDDGDPHLDIQLPHLVEEPPDPLVVLALVQ